MQVSCGIHDLQAFFHCILNFLVCNSSLVSYSFFSRSTLASYILGLDGDGGKNMKNAEDIFFSIFSALLDALLLRAQVFFFLPFDFWYE